MLRRWSDFDNTITMLDEFRRQMDYLFDEFSSGRGYDRRYIFEPFRGIPLADGWTGGWPRMSLTDEGSSLMLRAEVPGLSEKDVHVSVNQDVLTISGERAVEAPEGYSVHRQERPGVKFSRSFALPAKIDLEKVAATVKNGVLTVRLVKAPESQPRQITVKAN